MNKIFLLMIGIVIGLVAPNYAESRPDYSLAAEQQGPKVAEACNECANGDMAAKAKANAEQKYPTSNDSADPQNKQKREGLEAGLKRIYDNWQAKCAWPVKYSTIDGQGIRKVQTDAAAFADETSTIKNSNSQSELASSCAAGADTTQKLSQFAGQQSSPMSQKYAGYAQGLAPMTTENAPWWEEQFDLPARQSCKQANENFSATLANATLDNVEAMNVMNAFNTECKNRVAALQEAAKDGFTLDKAMKIGQLAQMGMGAMKTVADMNAQANGDPTADGGVGFGEDPFDFDTSNGLAGDNGGSGFFGPGGSSGGPKVATAKLDDNQIVNGVQSAFVSDVDPEASTTGAASPTGSAPVASAIGSAGGGIDPFTNNAATGGGGGTEVAAAGGGGGAGGGGAANSSGASRLPASTAAKDGDSDAGGGGGGGGGFGGGGGGFDSMLGLSTDPGGMDDLMGGFKNPFGDDKKDGNGGDDGPLMMASTNLNSLPRSLASASTKKAALSKESLFFRVHHRIAMRRERGDVR